MVYGAAVGAVAYGGYSLAKTLNGHERDGLSPAEEYAQYSKDFDRSVEEERKKKYNAGVYAPDRPLPRSEDGVPIPDTDAPHTQLGIRESKRRPGEEYPQAREFDKNGKPVKSIDFTDHREPSIHPNPHEHRYEANPTGGTPYRGDPKPLENWKY